MGHRASRPSGAELEAQIAMLPPPRYEPDFWMASCCSCGTMTSFNSQLVFFQPDCRLICFKHTACKMVTAAHREMFIHMPAATFKIAAQRDVESRVPCTVVVNRPDTSMSLPFVPQCWLVQLPEMINAPSLPQELNGRSVAIWVHGFRQKYLRVVSVANHLYRSLDGKSDPRPVVVAFLWPCSSGKMEYRKARKRADQAASELTRLLELLSARGCFITIVAHSLGCRVALKALLKTSDVENSHHVCSHLFLLAAAVQASALAPSGEFPRTRISAQEITAMYTVQDRVLRSYFGTGENVANLLSFHFRDVRRKVAAIGLDGVATPLPAQCSSINQSDAVGGHNPNIWLMSPEVMGYIISAVQRHSPQGWNPCASHLWPALADAYPACDDDDNKRK